MAKGIKLKKFIACGISLCMGLSMVISSNLSIGLNTVYAEEETAGISPYFINYGETPIYTDRENYSFEERAADLIARMTQQEKLSQLVAGMSPAIPRLGLNWWGWWNECLHGVSRYQNYANSAGTTELWNTVSYPIPLSMGHTWDTELEYRVAQAIGEEARETADGNYRNLSFYTPTVNLTRDPRWGRGDESQGEDPFQAAAIASQFVNGMEGKDMEGNLLDENGYLQSITTLKHYLANNTEHNRVNGSSNMSERDLREYYADVYGRIIKLADPGSVMSSYQRVNEVPSTANVHTLETILRQTLGFDGFITTDCDSMGEITTASRVAPYALFSWPTQGRQNGGHAWRPKAEPGLATSTSDVDTAYPSSDPKNAVMSVEETIAWSSLAGTDVECNGGVQGMGNNSYAGSGSNGVGGGNNAVNRGIDTPMGKLTVNAIDINAHRLLAARMKIGEFDMKTPGVVKWYDEVRERINNNYGEGWTWFNDTNNGAPTMTEERKELAREAAAKALVLLKNDPAPTNGNKPLLPLDVSKEGLKVAVIGYAANPDFGPSTAGIGYVSGTNDKLQGGYSALYGNDSFKQFVYPFKGIEAAILKDNPTAEVKFTRASTQNIGGPQINANAFVCDTASVIEAAKWADVCIVYAWTNLFSANEERDRGIGITQGVDNMENSTLALSAGNVEMINAVKENSNGNIVLVMETSGPNFVEGFEAGIPAMVFSSFNGQEKGNALADVLLGKYNPSARTSVTWFKDGQLSDLRSYKMAPGTDTMANARDNNTTNERSLLEVKGRTYMYYDEAANGAVMYPFGYGLCYSTFDYSNFSISSTNVNPNQTITVSFDVKNTSNVAGSVVPQLYVKTPAEFGSEYPIKRLRGFEMVKLDAGQTKRVTLTLPVEEFKFFNDDPSAMKYEVKPGTYRVQLSNSSADADEKMGWNVVVTGALTPKVSVVTAKPVIKNEDTAANIPQRLIFGLNKEVDPQLTVCMSDDSLYGYVNSLTPENTADYPYISPAKKSAIPSTMTITYTSNRPSVVEVDGSGNIKTKSAGVATITATVTDTISGSSSTCDFVVYVASDDAFDYMTSIKVAGKELLDPEKPEVDRYEIGLPRGTKAAPIVTASAAAGSAVSIKQAASVPGTAYASVTNPAGVTYTYAINFGFLPTPDALTAKDSSLWNITNADGKAVNDENGLSWTVPRAVRTIHSSTSTGNALPTNIYLQNNVAGDWEATVKVSLSNPGNGLNAGIVLYQQRTNYVAVTIQRTASAGQIRFYHANNASSRTNINGDTGVEYNDLEAYLKLKKVDNIIKAYYSPDGVNWTDAGGELELNASYIFPSIGIYAATDTALTVDPVVTFKDFDTAVEFDVNATMQEKGSIAEVTVSVNNDNSDTSRAIYAAAYDSKGKLILVSSQDIDNSKSSQYTFNLDVSKANGDYTVKVFVWEKDSMIPCIEALTVPKQ